MRLSFSQSYAVPAMRKQKLSVAAAAAAAANSRGASREGEAGVTWDGPSQLLRPVERQTSRIRR